MIAIGSDINPPAPRPCTPRNRTSCIMDSVRPDRIDPIRKMMIDAWNMRLRPCRSPSFPHTGVEHVDVSR